jgi:hypothetical protein
MEVAQNAKLAQRCEELADVVRQAGDWVGQNRDLVRGDHAGLLAELRRSGRFFNRCHTAATRKMCVGVFGPSQAGKSYLISALARDAAGTLLADFGGETLDFISEINPEGGLESTGLVTRFTMTRPESIPPGFPLQIRLLSETDLVKIFANTYYADCEHQDEPDVDRITETLDALEKKQQPSPGRVTLDDLEELQEYLAKNFKAKPRVQELGRSFWPRALAIGPRLELKDRLRLYGLIWDQVEPFDWLLGILAQALEQLGHPDVAYCPLAALIPREKSIIDVAMLELNKLHDSVQDDCIEVLSPEKRKVNLPRAVVTALTAELSIVMLEKPDDYYEHTDLLDFPGYRSRYKIRNIRSELEDPTMLKELFRRGKVAYLFQRYCAERELTSMLLCIGPSNQEVQDLPGVINDWILSTHGETPERRRGKLISLYFVLTKSDLEFEQKAGAPSLETRWEKRLQASLLDFFGLQHDWPKNWDGEKKFNNIFLLRNPNYRFDAVLFYDEKDRESGVRPDKEEFVAKLQQAFLQHPLVKEHFEEPVPAWDALMQLNDGGIGRIREKLRPACNPALKRQQIETALLERQERLFSRFKPYWKSDDKQETRQQKALLGQQLARIFAALIQGQRFGEFLHALCLQDHELHTLYYEARREMDQAGAEGESASPAVSVVGRTVEAVDLLRDIFGDTTSEENPAHDPDVPAPAAPPLDETAAFAARIESHWCRHLRELSDDPVLQQYFGLPQKEFAAFVGELIQGMGRLNLRGDMEEAMRKAAAYADTVRERLVWKQASLAAARINAFVDWLGYNPRCASEADRTVLVAGKRVTVFTPPPPVTGYPRLAEEMGTLERQWYRDWLMSLVACIMANVDFDGATALNVEQNRILGDIVRMFSPQQ